MARAKTAMKKILEILRLHKDQGLSQRKVARASGCSLGTVNKVLRGAARAGLEWPLEQELSEEELQQRVFGASPVAPGDPRRQDLSFEDVYRDMQKHKHLTTRLAWEEYRAIHENGYGYSQFCHLFREWRRQRKVTMAQEHKAGEAMFVDYAGSTVTIFPPGGEPWQAPIFSAVLGASSFFYSEGCRGQDLESWIGANVRTLNEFGGSPKSVVPDNLKSGVTKADLYEPRVNQTYLEFARHYGMAVLPARPGKPQDKAKVESNVRFISQNILARLRKERFASLAQLNAVIAEHRDRLNAQPFQGRTESRRELFETVDRPALQPLPAKPYEFALWLRATVNVDHHVTVKGHHYSAPAALVQQRVDVRLTEHSVELLHGGERVGLHVRSSRRGGYTTIHEHRPKSHKEHLDWPPERIKLWAAQEVGPRTGALVSKMLDEHEYPQEHYRPCLGIIRLARHYGADRLEAASRRALHYGQLSYRSIKRMLESKADRLPLDNDGAKKFTPVEHRNVRGGSYYRGESGAGPQQGGG